MAKNLSITVIDLIEQAARNVKTQPMNLGGIAGAGGGVGAPPGGYIGWLPQTRVAYDEDELATLETSISGSLLDNLNHIRARLNVVESGTLIVDDWDGSPTIEHVQEITFSGAIVTQLNPGHVLVVVSGGIGGAALTVEENDGSPVVNNVDRIIFSGAVVTDLGGGDVRVTISGGGGSALTVEELDGIPTVNNVNRIIVQGGAVTDAGGGVIILNTSASLDSTYLRLDTTNDPLTGDLQINVPGNSSTGYGLKIVTHDQGDAGLYAEAAGSGFAAWLIGKGTDAALYLDQDMGNSDISTTAAVFLDRYPLDSTPIIYSGYGYLLADHKNKNYANGSIDVTVYGGTLEHVLYSGVTKIDTLAQINPWAVNNGKLLYLNAQRPFASSGRYLSLNLQGVEKISADGDGNFNIPSGATYNINNIPHTHSTVFNDAEGDPATIGTTADGTSIYASRRDHVHAITNGSAVLGSSFSITGTAGTFQDTGLSVTLPSAGTYKITCNVRGAMVGNAGTSWWITAELYNSTDAAVVTNSETIVVLTGTTNLHLQNTAPIDMIITVAASKVIKLYAARNGTATPSWTVSDISSDSNGKTRMMYEKIG